MTSALDVVAGENWASMVIGPVSALRRIRPVGVW
jgi:hypothetical protein